MKQRFIHGGFDAGSQTKSLAGGVAICLNLRVSWPEVTVLK